jgi:hypothetical protein
LSCHDWNLIPEATSQEKNRAQPNQQSIIARGAVEKPNDIDQDKLTFASKRPTPACTAGHRRRTSLTSSHLASLIGLTSMANVHLGLESKHEAKWRDKNGLPHSPKLIENTKSPSFARAAELGAGRGYRVILDGVFSRIRSDANCLVMAKRDIQSNVTARQQGSIANWNMASFLKCIRADLKIAAIQVPANNPAAAVELSSQKHFVARGDFRQSEVNI